tara:strand:- start:1147 stop:1515 length:369 start_codon:yes stop_codon:yes gene_type:complete
LKITRRENNMGAHESNVVKVGKYRDASQAYAEAVREAQHEHGHSGYNGTISTSHGFVMRKDSPRYGTKKFWKFYDDKIDGTKFAKWNCVEIKGAILKRIKQEYGYKGKRGIKAFYFWGLAAS